MKVRIGPLMNEAESMTATSTGNETVVEVPDGDEAGQTHDGGVDWTSLSEPDDLDSGATERTVAPATDETGKSAESQPPAEPKAETPPETPPAAPAAAATPPAVTTPEPAKPSAAEPAPVEKTPAQIAAEQRAAAEAARKAEEELLVKLVERYKVSDELAAKLQTEPELVLPQLLAKAHLQAFKDAQQAFLVQMPNVFQVLSEQQRQVSSARSAFFDEWPQLAEHEAAVLEVGKLFRAANKTATKDQAIATIGEMAARSLGLDPTPKSKRANGGTPPAAQTPAAAAPVPFKPAGGGGSGRGAPPKSDNIFETMAEDFLAEDAG